MDNNIKTSNSETENRNAEKDFYIYRNTVKTLSDSVSLATANFKRIVKLSLPVTIPLALILTVLIISSCRLGIYGNISKLSMFLIPLAGVICATLQETIYYRFILIKAEGGDIAKASLKDIYDKTLRNIGVKALIYNIISSILMLIGIAIIAWLVTIKSNGFGQTLVKIIIVSLVSLFMLAVVIAYRNVLPTIMLREGKLFSNFIQGFKFGRMRFGKMMQIVVLVFFITAILDLLLMSPAVVFSLIDRSSLMSALNGDTISLPSHFQFYSYLIIFLTSWIYIHVMWVNFAPLAYNYATLVVEEKERKAAGRFA